MLPSARALSALSLLARVGSLAAAAEQAGVTRSALSHRIAELEKSLGVALVRKMGRKLELTEDGQRLLARMGDALDRIDAATAPFQRDRGQIRLSTVSTFASHWLLPRLADFQARHPRIEIALSTTTRPVDLGAEDVDCAIRHGSGAWKGLASNLLFTETLMPVVAASRAGARSARAWPKAPLIKARSRFIDWTYWQKQHGKLRDPTWLTVETRAQALDAALAGAGIALMDMAYVGDHVEAGRLTMLAREPVRLATGYYVVHEPQVRNNPRALTVFRDWVVEAARPFREASAEAAPG
jgi:DNA-binding transcriptional LysR family regulator